MKISFQYRLKLSAKTLAVIEELSFHTTKLYNTVNYDLHEHGLPSSADRWKLKYSYFTEAPTSNRRLSGG